MTLVVVFEADEERRKRFERIIRSEGFDAVGATDGFSGLRAAFLDRPDAALVDLDTPGLDGVQLLRILRSACDIPLIAIAPALEPDSVVRTLDAGADDVIDNGCAAGELIARLRAAIRRYDRRRGGPGGERLVQTGDLEINRDTQAVLKQGVVVSLTRTEYRLLDKLAGELGTTLTHQDLLSTVWGAEYVNDTHYLRVYIGYLRSKLEDDPASPRLLINEWGIGYRLARLPTVNGSTERRSETVSA